MVSFPWTSAFSCVWKRRRNGSVSKKVTVRMGLYVFLSAVRMGLWYCTDGSSWTSVHAGNQSARTHVATFVVQYAWTLSEVGNTHSFRYFGTNLLNQDNVTCNPYRGGLIMNWKANISSFLKYSSHSQFWFTVCFICMFTRFESSKLYLPHQSVSIGFYLDNVGDDSLQTYSDYHSNCFQFANGLIYTSIA